MMRASSGREHLAHLIAIWFGCGLSPIAPGTAGSLAAILLATAAHQLWSVPALWIAAAGFLLFPLGSWAGTVEANLRQKKDPGQVVVDEVSGQWITLAGATTLNWKTWVGAFLLFRLLDIWKPFPARQLEALPGGTGIMADDAMAGIYGSLILFMAGWFNWY